MWFYKNSSILILLFMFQEPICFLFNIQLYVTLNPCKLFTIRHWQVGLEVLKSTYQGCKLGLENTLFKLPPENSHRADSHRADSHRADLCNEKMSRSHSFYCKLQLALSVLIICLVDWTANFTIHIKSQAIINYISCTVHVMGWSWFSYGTTHLTHTGQLKPLWLPSKEELWFWEKRYVKIAFE